MQFPNGVNKSNLIKLGVLGAAMYLMKNRNSQSKTPAPSTNTDVSEPQSTDQGDKKPATPFELGKSLANKFLGRKA